MAVDPNIVTTHEGAIKDEHPLTEAPESAGEWNL